MSLSPERRSRAEAFYQPVFQIDGGVILMCRRCGAVVIVVPDSQIDGLDLHEAEHERLDPYFTGSTG